MLCIVLVIRIRGFAGAMMRWGEALVVFGFSVSFIHGKDYIDGDDTTDGIDADSLTSEQIRSIHERLDGNRDGKASLAEVEAFSSALRSDVAKKDIHHILDEMDGDKDGKLSLDELLKDLAQWGESDKDDQAEVAQRRGLESEKFMAADLDGDKLLSLDELPALFYPETQDAVLHVTVAATLTRKDKDGDGRLTIKEFWEGDALDGEEIPISKEEKAEFKRLDRDGSGQLDIEELKRWESGNFHTEEAMRRLFDIADKDGDMHVSADELDEARKRIAGSEAQYHLMEWAEHHDL